MSRVARSGLALRVLVGAAGLCCIPLASQAQSPVSTGVWILGGTARVTGFKDHKNAEGEFGFEIAPQVGRMVTGGLALSLSGLLGYSSRDSVGKTFWWGMGPAVSYYIAGVHPRLYPFATLKTTLVRRRFTPAIESSSLPVIIDRDATWSVAGGVALFLGRNVAATGEAFYSRGKFVLEVDEVGESTNTSTLYGLQFGFRLFIY